MEEDYGFGGERKMQIEGNLISLYSTMKRIRMIEERIGLKFQDQEMRTAMHLSIGQEAIAAGVCQNLSKHDIVYSNHRGHGHYIAKGGNIRKLIAELYNRSEGCSKGHGGSMHIIDPAVGFRLTSSIVAGNVPIATGEAMGMKMKHSNNVVVVFFGDGASEEGCVYESVCFAQVKKLPIIYVCENNLYAMYTTLDKREPNQTISSKFESILPTILADGNDAEITYKTSASAIDHARNGMGPTLIEFNTYRFVNHYETKNGDPLGYRPQKEYDEWLNKCPVKNLENKLLANNFINLKDIEQLKSQINEELNEAFEYALNGSLPKPDNIMKGLWG